MPHTASLPAAKHVVRPVPGPVPLRNVAPRSSRFESATGCRRDRSAAPPRSAAAASGREALDTIDLGLRRLDAECTRAGRRLPDVHAVTYAEDRLLLRLTVADKNPPAPWEADDTGERFLIDLSRSSAPIAVTGDGEGVRQLVRALVTELITGPVGRRAESRWWGRRRQRK
ncbi:hypothetical protein ACODT3_37210 [Streptomyces sp. 4.24]|uniref:hypothetical protein n=1 Tax=Streptomyces tritrimontium TaxID=3406573 RepID=UPI003BB53D96